MKFHDHSLFHSQPPKKQILLVSEKPWRPKFWPQIGMLEVTCSHLFSTTKNERCIHERCIQWYIYICQQVTRKALRKNTHKTAPLSSKSPLLFCDRGASLCNPGLLAGEFNVSIQKCMVPSDGPNPSQSEGGHLEGTQAEGEWIPQDFQGSTNVPTTSRGCNLPGGRFIESIQLSRWKLSLSRSLSVHGVIRQAICRRWWQLWVFFRWLGVHWPVCGETKESKAPGALLVTKRFRSVVKRIKVLSLVDRGLPPATHPFVFRGQKVDLEGASWPRLPGGWHYPKRSVWWTQLVCRCLGQPRLLGSCWLVFLVFQGLLDFPVWIFFQDQGKSLLLRGRDHHPPGLQEVPQTPGSDP